jgi:hypothetical protein
LPHDADLPPLPAAYREFLATFARGEFWEAHEVLEQAWRQGRSGFYRGLILLASAWVHARRGNAHGVAAQLRKAERELAPYAPAYLGQDVDGLLARARAGAARAPSLASASLHAWADALPPPDLTPRPDLIRGDEPELSGA